MSIVFSNATFLRRYHVPRNQVWQGSRGRQHGNVHVHVTQDVAIGRIRREAGETLCGKRRGWYERPPYPNEANCQRCEDILARYAAQAPPALSRPVEETSG